MTKPDSPFNFSKSMSELEEITRYLEGEAVDLDEAIKRFERGSEIAKELKTYLQSAENKIETLRQSFDKKASADE